MIKRWLKKTFGIRWHSRREGKFHRRRWLYIGQITLGIESVWLHKRDCFWIHLDLDGDNDAGQITLAITVPWLFSLYLWIHYWPLHKILPGKWVDSRCRPGTKFKMATPREIGLFIGDGRVSLSLWHNPNDWSRDDPWWWEFTVHPIDFLLGRSKYSERNLSMHDDTLRMPEGYYDVKIRMFESTWKRSRWPWHRRMVRAEIECYEPIPVPGKGENSWDLDDDAVHSMTCLARTPEDAMNQLIASIYRDRERYGGIEWLPNDAEVT